MMTPRVRSYLLVILAIAMLVVSGCSATTSSSKNEPTPTPIPPPPIPEKPTYTVRAGEVVDSLSFTGRIAPVIEEELYFRDNGRVKQVFVERNDEIVAGTVMAELENDDLLRQLAQAQIELESAELSFEQGEASRKYSAEKARVNLEISKLQLEKLKASLADIELNARISEIELAEFKAGPDPDDVEISLRNLEKSKNSLWSSQINRDTACGRDNKGSACDSGQASVQRSEEDVRIAEINYRRAQKGPTAQEIEVQEAEHARTLAQMDDLKADIAIKEFNVYLAQMEYDKLEDQADANLIKSVERAKLSVERLSAQLADREVASPIDGKVTSVSAYAGREVQAYRGVFVVADETDLEVTAEPMSSQMQRLAENMSAVVILSAYPGKELPAEITLLPYPYGRGGGTNTTAEDADKLTHITFDPQDLAIEPGDLVKVIVVIEEKPAALWLPPAAIRTFAGRKFVVVDDNGQQRRVDVTIGIESAERVEITDGLEEGQIVIGQ